MQDDAPPSLRFRIADQWYRYRKAALWVVRDAWSTFPLLMSSALALNAIYLILQFGALGILAGYIHALELGHPVTIAGLELPPIRSSPTILIVVAAFCLVMLLVAFLAYYAAESRMLRVWTLYEERCTARAIFLIAAQGDHPEAKSWQPHFRRLTGSDARYCGLVTRISLRLFTPLATWIGTFGMLIYLDYRLTVTLAGLVLVAVPLLYRTNLRGASHTKAIEKRAKQAALAKQRATNRLVDKLLSGASVDAQIRSQVDLKGIRPYLNAQAGKRLTMEESRLITSSLMGVSIFAILLQKGGQILTTGSGWAELAAYFVILRISLNALTGSAKLFANINRYYPHFSRYISFVQQMEVLVERDLPHPLRLRGPTRGDFDDDEDEDGA